MVPLIGIDIIQVVIVLKDKRYIISVLYAKALAIIFKTSAPRANCTTIRDKAKFTTISSMVGKLIYSRHIRLAGSIVIICDSHSPSISSI